MKIFGNELLEYDSSQTVESTLPNFRVRVESESLEKSDSSRLESES